MLVINTSQLLIELRKIIGNFMEPEYPTMFYAPYVVIPGLDWWQHTFFPNWIRYVENSGLRNYGGNYCELFVMEARCRALRAAGLWSEKAKQDCTISLYEARTRLNGPYFNIVQGPHITCLLIYNENNKPFFSFWEPQNPHFQLISVPATLSNLDFRDCGM
jgi:hypothetical protein